MFKNALVVIKIVLTYTRTPSSQIGNNSRCCRRCPTRRAAATAAVCRSRTRNRHRHLLAGQAAPTATALQAAAAAVAAVANRRRRRSHRDRSRLRSRPRAIAARTGAVVVERRVGAVAAVVVPALPPSQPLDRRLLRVAHARLPSSLCRRRCDAR